MNKMMILWFAIAIVSCTSPVSVKESKEIKVLILGNSIVRHGPYPSLGWYGDWGMAASSADKDFVHVLVMKLKGYKHNLIRLFLQPELNEQPFERLDYRAKNIAGWERNFDFDFGNEELVQYDPDILVIRLGENVPEDYARKAGYGSALVQLINRFKGKHSHIVVTGNFWPSVYKDSIQERVARDDHYTFVDLSDLSKQEGNSAQGRFADGGVAAHPSDQGMLGIAEKIAECIEDEKWY